MNRVVLSTLLVLLASLSPAPAGGADPASGGPALDPAAALRRGNRAFREGRLEAAVGSYVQGAGQRPTDPVLCYNLGTALHALGRLPEAVLWYRRARAAGSEDPWLADNLARARSELAAPRLGPPALLAPLLLHPWLPRAVAAGLAWSGLLAALLGPSRRGRAACVLLIAALAAWLGAVAARELGPRPAVLLAACSPALPAGTELWVVRDRSGGFRVTGLAVHCPAPAVAPIEPEAR